MSRRDRTVLLTGASGLIGAAVHRQMRSLGYRDIVCASRDVAGPGTAGASPDRLQLDLLGEVDVPAGIDTIVHLAGEKSDADLMWRVNHEGTRKLVEAAARAGVRRFLYLSSVGVYGARKHSGVIGIDHQRKPRNVYEASKNAGEQSVRALCPRSGIEHVVLQPTNVVGHLRGRSYPLLSLMSAIDSGRFVQFGSREAWVNYIGVDDVAAIVARACERADDGSTYVVNTPARLSELVGWIGNELGRAAGSRRLPAWIGAVAGIAGSAATRIGRRQTPFDSARYLELTNTTVYDGDPVRRALDFDYPVGIENTVRGLVRAYRSEGRL